MTLSATNRSELKTFFTAFTDRVLPYGDEVYVDGINGGDAPGADAVEQLATDIDYSEGGGVCLFTGQRGTGKSTELKRLQARLNEMGMVCFYADMSEYLLMTKPVEVSDFLVSMAGALSEAVSARYDGKSPGNRNYWVRIRDFLHTRVQIDEVGFNVGEVVDIKAALKMDPTFKQQVQERSRGHVTTLIADARTFAQEAVQMVRTEEGDPAKKVVLILDSIERIRGVGPEDMSVYNSVRNLFFGHADALRIPLLHVVYTVPPYLPVLAAAAGALMGGAMTGRLVSTHIFKDRSRDTDPAGLALMHKVVGKRFAGWEKVFSAEALDRLALSSGGDLREFFRMLRLCITAVRNDEQLPIAPEAVGHAENAARADMLPIPADHLAWLKDITSSHECCLPSDTLLPVLSQFLDNRLVMVYRNGSDWYDVHPLLRDVVDAHVCTST